MHTTDNSSQLATYFKLRLALGVVAFTFPLVVLAGGLLTENSVLPSISDYYFSPMRDFVVGALVAIGIFLMNYKEPKTSETPGSRGMWIAAGTASIGLAIFPNQPHSVGIETFFHIIMDDKISVGLHFLCSFIFLSTLTDFCLRRFTKNSTPLERKIHILCGLGLVTAGVVATYFSFVRAFDWYGARTFVEHHSLIFWLESIGIWSFCISWIVKGLSEERESGVFAYTESRHFASRWVPSQ